ncbi:MULTISPECIES: hypothetical protein [unclassified Rhizobium]|uniref:hypothetical protein n=1 Tax=unclassified Rhizobium TaxID=2613769 RepID=UPI0037FE23A1
MSSNDTGIYAQFYFEPVEQAFETEKQGRPIFKDTEFVRIFIAGDQRTEVTRPATEMDKVRFADIYRRFKDGAADHEQSNGTPLSQWTMMKPSQIKELQAINIYTVEHLAALSDTGKQQLGMGAHELVAAASAYLANARDSNAAAAFAAENERLKTEVARLEEQMKLMAKQMEAMEADHGAGRRNGRAA